MSLKNLTQISCEQRYPTSLAAMLVSLREHWDLILQMSQRTIAGRYKGSLIGAGWSLITPLMLLAVYTFVFGVVYRARWGGSADMGLGGYAIFLFSGLIVHALLAECINTAPKLITSNASYVKKIVFPIEVFSWITVFSALFHMVISVIILIGAQAYVTQSLSWTVILFPLVVAPLILFAAGITWFLAALGVYVRDINQITGMVSIALLFLAPVFYPLSRIPESYQPFLYLNPLTFVIEEGRQVILLGEQPDWSGLCIYSLVAIAVAQFGFWWFQRTRRGFADVL